MVIIFPIGVSETWIYFPPLWLSHKKQGPQVETTDLSYRCLLLFKSSMAEATSHFIESSLVLVTHGFLFGELSSWLIHFVELASLWFSPLLPAFSLTSAGRVLMSRKDTSDPEDWVCKRAFHLLVICLPTIVQHFWASFYSPIKWGAIVSLPFTLSLAYKRFWECLISCHEPLSGKLYLCKPSDLYLKIWIMIPG